MQIDWQVVSCIFIGFFAIAGFSRGWWKEGLTTFFFTILVLFLQQPTLAQRFIDLINSLIELIWNLIPIQIWELFFDISDGLISTTGSTVPPIQAEAGSPGTWIIILISAVALSIFLGRIWLRNAPTTQGSLLGFLLGGVNGFIALNLVREYLDGRALPGNVSPPSTIVVAGNTAFGQAASSVTVQAANLPSFTILDSNIPWFIIGIGALIAFAVLRTRFAILTGPQGVGRKISYQQLPPFYQSPPKRPSQPTLAEILGLR